MARDLSRRNWDSPTFRRLLFSTDVLANSTTILMVVSSTVRLQTHLPTDVTQLHFGPKLPLFNFWITAGLYVLGSLAALLLLTCRRTFYFRHRLRIALLLRLVRLYVQALINITPSSAINIASAIVARVHDNPQKAPAMLVIHPMVYYTQAAMMLLPWRYMLAAQMLSTLSMLHYLWQFPCYLQRLLPDASTYTWQPCAEESCSRLQAYAALASTAVGGSLADFSPTVCKGMAGLQVLQVFGLFVCVFVAPVVLAYEWERWMHQRCGQMPSSQPAAAHTSGRSGSGGGSSGVADSQPLLGSGAGSSSSSAGAVAGSRRGPSAGAGTSAGPSSSSSSSLRGRNTAPGSSRGGSGGSSRGAQGGAGAAAESAAVSGHQGVSLMEMAAAAAVVGSSWGHPCMLLLVLGLGMPVLWMLAELLAGYWAATRDCSAIQDAALGGS